MEKNLNAQIRVHLNKVAISNNFIVIEINKEKIKCPYYGN
jgi:hypothetical protein